VQITKPVLDPAGDYAWLISPQPYTHPNEPFTVEARVRTREATGNKFGIRINNNNGSTGSSSFIEIYIQDGYVSPDQENGGDYTYELDTAEWHDYRIVVNADKTYSLYVDGYLAFENVAPLVYTSNSGEYTVGADLIKFGADSWDSCDMDIEYAKVANGALIPPAKPAINKVTLNPVSQELGETSIYVTVETSLFEDGDKVKLTLLDGDKNPLYTSVTDTVSVSDNAASATLSASGLPIGYYFVKAEAVDDASVPARYVSYQVKRATSTIGTEKPDLPDFEPIGYTIEHDDYTINPTREMNFPSIVDTNEHWDAEAAGGPPKARYYLFFSPHNAPGGVYVAWSESLYGPWEEPGSKDSPVNPVIENKWSSYYNVSHVSSPDVIWNDTFGQYFLYFHGENDVTRYATSYNLVNWTYGGVAVVAKDFHSSAGEASYARVFKHEIPGLGNSYVMTIMISDSTRPGQRKIYYAYSSDGKTWTAAKEALLRPDNSKAPDGISYDATEMGGLNFSGAFFLPWEDKDGSTRYLALAHASTGDMYVFEVGEGFDNEKHWGYFYESKGENNSTGWNNEDNYPDFGRASAPVLIQDDGGVWHMFYEAGRRLNNNIVHAVETFSVEFVTNVDGVTIEPISRALGNVPIEEPERMENEGYEFGGWFTDGDFTSRWDFETSLTSDIILYAKWTQEGEGSSGEPESGGEGSSGEPESESESPSSEPESEGESPSGEPESESASPSSESESESESPSSESESESASSSIRLPINTPGFNTRPVAPPTNSSVPANISNELGSGSEQVSGILANSPSIEKHPSDITEIRSVAGVVAEELNKLGLFVGTETTAEGIPTFELRRPLTRLEALTLVVRLLGLEKTAGSYQGDNTFTDVPAWGDRITAYAYSIGITVGINDAHTLFAPNKTVTYQEFTAFLLRVLEYYEKNGDFEYSQALQKAMDIGMYSSAEAQSINNQAEYLRADAVIAITDVLLANIHNNENRLIEKLVLQGVITKDGASSFIEYLSRLYN
jgi:uncharacterized repeat protein (TIGR02543 family)